MKPFSKGLNAQDRIVSEQCLDYKFICDVMGLPMDRKNESYRTVCFAFDAYPGCAAIVSDRPSSVDYITSDTRCLQLADQAMKKGAKLLIANKQIRDYPTMVVEKPVKVFVDVVTALRRYVSPKSVCVTGSIGKTTTTQMVYTMMGEFFDTHHNTSSANNIQSAGSVVQHIRPRHEMYVQELMEGPPYGVAKTISQMVQPQAAIVTLVGTSHMEHFGTQQRILESCLCVQEHMPEDGLLILNGDDPFQRNAKGLCKRQVVYYAIDNTEADFRAINIRGEGDRLAFEVLHNNSSTTVQIYCFGKHNVLDALAAFAAGHWAGLTNEQIATGLAKYRPEGIRQNLVNFGGYRLYLDCYNSSPESIISALDAMSTISVPPNGRKVAVLGDVAEVSGHEEEFHRQIGRSVLDSCIDMAICYGKNAEYIADEIRNSGVKPVYYAATATELISLIKKHICHTDLTLFKGSHSMKLELFVDKIWGTWFHEDYENFEFRSRRYEDGDFQYIIYTDHATAVKKISVIEDVVIPNYVEGIPVTGVGRSLFNESKYTKSVRLSNRTVSIRKLAFYNSKITNIALPASLRIIDVSAFSTCENLKSVVIESGCTHIGNRAFFNCKNLESITIPATVKLIGDEAFLNDKKLTIYGEAGSYAQRYAESRKIPFKVLG